MHSSIHADQLLRELALAIARNDVGAKRPTYEIVAGEGLTQTEYDAIATNPQFQRYVDAYTRELTESGFSFEAKNRVLAEASLPTLYHMAHDPDTPAAVRRQIVADFVEWGKLKPKTGSEMTSGPGFSITINIPQVGQTPPKTLVFEAETGKNTPKNDEIPLISAEKHVPIAFSEAEDYEYAGEDYL